MALESSSILMASFTKAALKMILYAAEERFTTDLIGQPTSEIGTTTSSMAKVLYTINIPRSLKLPLITAISIK